MTTVPQRGQDRVSLSIGTRNASWSDIAVLPRAILRGIAEQLWELGVTTELGAWPDSAQYLVLSLNERAIGRLLLWPGELVSVASTGCQTDIQLSDPDSIPRIIDHVVGLLRSGDQQ